MPPKRFERSRTSSRVGSSAVPPLLEGLSGTTGIVTVPATAVSCVPAPSRNTDRSTSGRSSSSAVGPWNRISPFSMKYAVSATVSATFTDCSTRMIVVPAAFSSRTISRSWPTTLGASPSDSSSIMSRRGCSMNAMPSVSICC